jgi:hypothetical protein
MVFGGSPLLMPSPIATRAPRLAAFTGIVALVAGCTSPNPAYTGLELPGRARDAGSDDGPRNEMPLVPDATVASDIVPAPDLTPIADGRVVPEVSPAPDVVAAPDSPSQVDVGAGPADVAPEAAPAPDAVLACMPPILGTGTGLTAQYFDNSDFTGTQVTRTDATIDWSFGEGTPDPKLDADNFSVRWTGQLQPVTSGPYTFIADYNDGMRMFLDDRVVMYRWGPHITDATESATVMLDACRTYDLRFEFFDQGSAATARLAWRSATQTQQVVPKRQLYPVAPAAPVCRIEAAPGSGTGLKVEYFSGEPSKTPLATGKDVRVDVEWGTGAPAAGIPTDAFSARWTGKLEAPVDGPLTIYLFTDDVGRVRFDGKLLTDSWSEPFGPQEIAATVDVRAGQRYDLVVEHRDDMGGAFAHLYWSWPCHAREVIPISRLYGP